MRILERSINVSCTFQNKLIHVQLSHGYGVLEQLFGMLNCEADVDRVRNSAGANVFNLEIRHYELG